MERLSRRVAAGGPVERSQITEVGGGLGMAWSVNFLVDGDGAPAEARLGLGPSRASMVVDSGLVEDLTSLPGLNLTRCSPSWCKIRGIAVRHVRYIDGRVVRSEAQAVVPSPQISGLRTLSAPLATMAVARRNPSTVMKRWQA